MMLISSPQMHDLWFEKTLILVCQHDEDGAMGVVINREGSITVDQVMDNLQSDPDQLPSNDPTDDPTWWGGPVGTGTGFVLWRGKVEDDEGWNVAPDVAVSPSVERLVQLIQTKSAFHLCLGYAGWGPGQLDEEIKRGSWLAVDIDSSLVFDAPLSDRYDLALASLGLTSSTVWMQPIDE